MHHPAKLLSCEHETHQPDKENQFPCIQPKAEVDPTHASLAAIKPALDISQIYVEK
jgi:hypothetical protein